MVILLWYTSAFSEVIYVDFYDKILDWNFGLLYENSQILVVVFVSKSNFSFSFRFIDENCRIFVIVVVFVTKINLFSSTKICFRRRRRKKHWFRLGIVLSDITYTISTMYVPASYTFIYSTFWKTLSELTKHTMQINYKSNSTFISTNYCCHHQSVSWCLYDLTPV